MPKKKKKRKKNSKGNLVFKPKARLLLPPNRRHKTAKDYKRKKKVEKHELEY